MCVDRMNNIKVYRFIVWHVCCGNISYLVYVYLSIKLHTSWTDISYININQHIIYIWWGKHNIHMEDLMQPHVCHVSGRERIWGRIAISHMSHFVAHCVGKILSSIYVEVSYSCFYVWNTYIDDIPSSYTCKNNTSKTFNIYIFQFIYTKTIWERYKCTQNIHGSCAYISSPFKCKENEKTTDESIVQPQKSVNTFSQVLLLSPKWDTFTNYMRVTFCWNVFSTKRHQHIWSYKCLSCQVWECIKN